MPTYVYRCERCGEFELHQSMTEGALERCPDCGQRVQRLIVGGTGFILGGARGAANDCGRDAPCCGRETRCERPPCGK